MIIFNCGLTVCSCFRTKCLRYPLTMINVRVTGFVLHRFWLHTLDSEPLRSTKEAKPVSRHGSNLPSQPARGRMGERGIAVAVPVPHELTPGSAWLLRYARSFPGRPDQVREVRGFLREVLTGRPRADDALIVGSELGANACLHSRSGAPGGVFTMRAEISEGDYLYVAVEDDGGPWHPRARAVVPEHGLDLVQAIAGAANWGVSGGYRGRLVWARLWWPGSEHLTGQPVCADAERACADDEIAELGRMAGELAQALAARCLAADVATRPDGLPYLAVHAPQAPALTQRVYPQADWFFWPTAERIAASDDVSTAADVIAQVMGDGWGPASA
jgi:serine/threonine-protein kinase RsbW